MIDTLILSGIVGTIAGIITGLLPAIGPFLMMILAYPALQGLSPTDIVVFYSTMLIASNFSGSVTGILFGIPGENNSVVSSELGFKLSKRGHGSYALASTAWGSWLASLAAVVAMLVMIEWFSTTTFFYSSRTQALVLAIIYIIMLFTRRGVWLVLIGSLLATIGYNDFWGSATMLGVPSLANGINFLPVACAVTLIPMLYRELINKKVTPTRIKQFPSTAYILRRWWVQRWTWARSLISGFVLGLLPGIGTVVVGNASYVLEKKFSSSPSRQLLSAESSNNASAISSLIPLVCFGIPITLSEAILVNLLAEKNSIISFTWFQYVYAWNTTRLEWVYLMVALSATISLFVCWQLAPKLGRMVMINNRWLFWALTTILISTVIALGIQGGSLLLDMLTMLCLIPLGIYFRNTNTQILLLAFLLFDTSSTVFYNYYQLMR